MLKKSFSFSTKVILMDLHTIINNNNTIYNVGGFDRAYCFRALLKDKTIAIHLWTPFNLQHRTIQTLIYVLLIDPRHSLIEAIVY
jgi:hypothetical protein